MKRKPVVELVLPIVSGASASPPPPTRPPALTCDLAQLPASVLRQLLSEAEQREATALALERERLQHERRGRFTVATGDEVPVHLRSLAARLPEIMSLQQVARALGVCRRTVSRWVHRGQLVVSAPSPTARMMFTRDAVIAFMAQTTKGR